MKFDTGWPAPRAVADETIATVHGETRRDPYAWLRDLDDPRTMAYLQSEDAYARTALTPLATLQDELYAEMLSHIRQTDLSVPYLYGPYRYYSRTEEGRQYPIYARTLDGDDAPEEIVLDLNLLADGHAYLGLGAYEVSDDASLLAYSLDTTGYRQYTLRVRDLRTGVDRAERIERVETVAWGRDGKTLFYTVEDPVTKRTDRLYRYDLETAVSTQLYEETDDRYAIAVGRTNDRAYIVMTSTSKSTTESRVLPADGSTARWTTVVPRIEGHRYEVEHHDGRFYLLTNWEAEDFRLVSAPVETPGIEHWTEIVPARAEIHLDQITMFSTHIVLSGRTGGFGAIEVYDFATRERTSVTFPETVRSVFAGANPEYTSTMFRYAYSSFVTPSSVYDLDLATHERILRKETEVPGYDRSRYASELIFATATDGTKIPISLVRRASNAVTDSRPLLLYGYGSYGISVDPTFSPTRLALLDRGVTFAVAHIRGGGELGEAWRTAGHLDRKMTTFTDFIACAEHLIACGHTAADRLAIQGGSAGGLLVAAVANMRPDLFAGVVCAVPFVDVVNTMLDASLPLTTGEYLEWGDPNVAADYAYMMRYSPYDNVAAQPYPAMLVEVSINDSQVPYWEGAKLVARLRAMKTNDEPLLLLVNFGAGHGGASGRYDRLREIAREYAFILATIK